MWCPPMSALPPKADIRARNAEHRSGLLRTAGFNNRKQHAGLTGRKQVALTCGDKYGNIFCRREQKDATKSSAPVLKIGKLRKSKTCKMLERVPSHMYANN